MTADATISGLDALFRPRSIAIVGASEDLHSLSGRPLRILTQHGYPGRLYPVNPRHSRIGGLQVYPNVAAIPEPVDLCVIAVRAQLVPELLAQCATSGARCSVVFSSGFAEEGPEGARAEQQIATLARTSGMRILGPNAEGIFNVWDDIPVSFSPTVDHERGLSRQIPGNVAVVSQSGGLGFALFNWAQYIGVGISYVVSTGNEADIDTLTLVDYLIEDDRTAVVAMLVEGFRDLDRLSSVARRTHALGKSLVVAKLGRSKAGSRATLAHTAHEAGNDEEYQAAFDRWGIIRANDQEELLDICLVLSRGKQRNVARVGILTASGGAGVWLADACEAVGLEVPELDDTLQARLRPLMPSYGSPRNPVDATAQVVSSSGIATVLELLCSSPVIDTVALVTSLAAPDMLDREEDGIRAVLATTDKPIVVYSYTRPADKSIDILARLGLAWYPSPARTARALCTLADAFNRRGRTMSNLPSLEDPLREDDGHPWTTGPSH